MKLMKNISISLFLFSLLFFSFSQDLQAQVKNTHPKKANYFLKWDISDYEAQQLAKWDLLILDMETQVNSKDKILKIRKLNPDITILAYITSQEANADIYNSPWSYNASLRKKLADSIHEGWWLKNSQGHKITFWEGTYMLNISNGATSNSRGQKWNDFLPEFVNREILSTGLWDGVFYDNIWGDVAWVAPNIDINNTKKVESINSINKAWSDGVKKMLQKTRDITNNRYIILGNGRVHLDYQGLLNGVMFEGFPAPWESNGDWGKILNTYSQINNLNQYPKMTVINSYDNNRQNYRRVRFGLGSASMQDHGYFSFSFDVSNHGQVWWYDEYDAELGSAKTISYNIKTKENNGFSNDLWRRDFDNGIIVVNSSKEEKVHVFNQEQFQKINGTQDRSVNNGSIVNFVRLGAEDSVFLLNRESSVSVIKDNSFNNGDFIRVFNSEGKQELNGFFAYMDSYPANSQILISDIDNDGQDETLVNYRGIITIYKNGSVFSRFQPYDGKFSGEISFAVSDLDGDGTKEIVTGAGKGGGPHVRVFDIYGKPIIGGFFAYDKGFRGGVNVAVMDLNSNGRQEIITAAGPGGGPHIRVFDKDGNPLIGGFFAYEQNFKGGTSIATGDTNGNGIKEIISVPGPGRDPELKIFDHNGRLLKSFYAYDRDFRAGLRVMTSDLNDNQIDEILVGAISF